MDLGAFSLALRRLTLHTHHAKTFRMFTAKAKLEAGRTLTGEMIQCMCSDQAGSRACSISWPTKGSCGVCALSNRRLPVSTAVGDVVRMNTRFTSSRQEAIYFSFEFQPETPARKRQTKINRNLGRACH